MKIVGITRVRNAEKYIENTLNHVSKFVDEIYVYDDASTDNTYSICENHPVVKIVVANEKWNNTTLGRHRAEGEPRQLLYNIALNKGANWVYYFDADEYVEFSFSPKSFLDWVPGYKMRLFDFYIIEEDKNEDYIKRKWMGPEYRDIAMFFNTKFEWTFEQREPNEVRVLDKQFGLAGWVKHYGKALSIEDWERKCDYYSNLRWKGKNSELEHRWRERKGKAIHSKSDFGRDLITWDEKENVNKIVSLI